MARESAGRGGRGCRRAGVSVGRGRSAYIRVANVDGTPVPVPVRSCLLAFPTAIQCAACSTPAVQPRRCCAMRTRLVALWGRAPSVRFCSSKDSLLAQIFQSRCQHS